jgi:Protein of unknown function (DUF4232)
VIAILALFFAAQISPPCTAAHLSGTFKAVPGSPGAGNIVYALRVKNTSTHTCYVTGIPGVVLLDRRNRKLPTHPRPSQPGALTAVLVTLAPGKSTSATARFSPDVPGIGEQTTGQCEPTAYWLRVTPTGGGTLKAPVQPPTPVCEHGGMSWSVFTLPAH